MNYRDYFDAIAKQTPWSKERDDLKKQIEIMTHHIADLKAAQEKTVDDYKERLVLKHCELKEEQSRLKDEIKARVELSTALAAAQKEVCRTTAVLQEHWQADSDLEILRMQNKNLVGLLNEANCKLTDYESQVDALESNKVRLLDMHNAKQGELVQTERTLQTVIAERNDFRDQLEAQIRSFTGSSNEIDRLLGLLDKARGEAEANNAMLIEERKQTQHLRGVANQANENLITVENKLKEMVELAQRAQSGRDAYLDELKRLRAALRDLAE